MGISRFHTPQARTDYYEVYDAGLRTLPQPAETRDLATSFGTARVYRFGPADGPPLVLLPGRAGTAIMYRPNIAGLASGNPVYAVDPIGEAGRSVQTAPISDHADQAAWLTEVLAGLELSGVHLVGVSFGGWLAGNLAVRSADRLASVSLLDPVCMFQRFPVGLIARALAAQVPVLSRWARPAFLRWISGGKPLPTNDPVAGVIDAGIKNFRLGTPLPTLFTDEQLRSIPVPVLALIGGRSVVHSPQGAYARALSVGVTAELWPDATHSISAESPAEVNARVLEFIGACGPMT